MIIQEVLRREKNFQVRISDDMHQMLRDEALLRGVSQSDIIREAVEVYFLGVDLVRDDGNIVHEHANGRRVTLMIPGVHGRKKK